MITAWHRWRRYKRILNSLAAAEMAAGYRVHQAKYARMKAEARREAMRSEAARK